MERYTVLDVPIDNITMEEAEKRMGNMLNTAKAHVVFTPNPEILLRASRDKAYAGILRTANLSLPDGIGLVWVGRALGMPFRERVSGVDAMLALCALAEKQQKSIFLLGGKDGVAHKTAMYVQKKFPKLHIAGYSQDLDVLKKNKDITNADILFVALGAGKQEKWITEHIDKLPHLKIAMAVGGAFDMLSGTLPRAPRAFLKLGIEWVWRLALQPRKRFRRVINAVIVFPIKVLAHKVKSQKSKVKNTS